MFHTIAIQITGVMTQGRSNGAEWVTSFMVSYSLDAFYWQYVTDLYGNQRVNKMAPVLSQPSNHHWAYYISYTSVCCLFAVWPYHIHPHYGSKHVDLSEWVSLYMHGIKWIYSVNFHELNISQLALSKAFIRSRARFKYIQASVKTARCPFNEVGLQMFRTKH